MAEQDEDLGPAFRALSDASRRQILDLLHQAPRTTGALCQSFPALSRFAVMKHLAVLERAGLLVVERKGRERWNHLNAVPLQRIFERWLRPFEARWAGRLLDVKRLAESPEDDAKDAKEEPAVPMTPATMTLGTLQIEQEVEVRAPPGRVFEALTGDIGAWWGRPYLHSDQARALVLEPRLGGRFYEDWGGGAGALYATVAALRPAELLVLSGPFGMEGLVHNVVTFTLSPTESGTRLRLSHLGAGDITDERRQGYTAGWKDLLGTRLIAYLERGERLGLGHEPPELRPR